VRGAPSRTRESVVSISLPQFGPINAFATYDHMTALTDNGFVCSWGSNTYGEVRPDSTRRDIPTPVPVVLADGQTPFRLFATDTPLPARLCGDADWRNRLASWIAPTSSTSRRTSRKTHW
jgi:hypothetical protein